MKPTAEAAFVHATAHVEDGAIVEPGAKVWHEAQIRTGARVGARCIVGKGVFIDAGVVVGADSKLQNYACVYHGARLGRGVFVGPHAILTNDRYPRATAPDFTPLRDGDWEVGATVVEDGASLGAHCTILPGVRIGAWAMVAAGAVVTRDAAPYTLVAGVPARRVSWICRCGAPLDERRPGCRGCGELAADHPLRAT